MAASYVAELNGEFDEAREWLSRAQAVAPSPFYEIVATVRLAELVGRYGERLSHAYFTSSALARFKTLQNDALLREDHTLPLTLAEELAQGPHPADAAPLLTYYLQVIAPRVRGTKDEGMLDASAALTQGYIEEASGRSARGVASAANSRSTPLDVRRRDRSGRGAGRRSFLRARESGVRLHPGDDRRPVSALS